MKKMLYILLVFGGSAVAQVPAQQLDSVLRPAKTDSADFSNSTYKNDTSEPPPGQPARRDSLPMDDRKPKTPPKK